VSSILLADIGGTNSRFALFGANGQPERMRVIENDTSPISKRHR
jgi:glucokinase